MAVLLLGGTLAFAQRLTLYTEIAPPNQFLDERGQLTGFAVEVVQEIQKRVSSTDPITVVPWVRGYNELQQKPNVALFSMARSAERDPLFEWVGPISESSNVFYVKAGSPLVLRSVDDARQLARVGVYREDIRDQYLTHLGFTNLDRSVDQVIMVKKLMDGRIDAIASSSEGMAEVANLAGFDLRDLKEACAFQKVQTYIAFSKATPPAVVKGWKQALEAMKRDGSFAAIHHRYYPSLHLPGPETKPF